MITVEYDRKEPAREDLPLLVSKKRTFESMAQVILFLRMLRADPQIINAVVVTD